MTDEPGARAQTGVFERVLFPPVGGEGRVEAIVRRLGEAVALGLIEPGERLPSEAELSARLEVASVTLREALAILRQANVIETRRGRSGGTFIRGGSALADALQPTQAGALAASAVRALIEFGGEVESAAAGMSVARISVAELEHLRELIEKMASAPDLPTFLRYDARLHIEIAAASRNVHFTQTVVRVQSDLQPLMRALPEHRGLRRRLNRAHEALVKALEGRDEEAARSAARDHLTQMGDLLIGLAAAGPDAT